MRKPNSDDRHKPGATAAIGVTGIGVALFSLALGACSDPSSNAGFQNSAAEQDQTASRTAAAAQPCADNGRRLPITGICADAAVRYLNSAGGSADAPDGCAWVVQESAFADDALLYRALQCRSKLTRLTFSPAAHLAELSYQSAAWRDPEDMLAGQVLVRIAPMTASGADDAILEIARPAMTDPADRALCRVRKAGIDVWPDDALVVDVPPDQAAAMPDDMPRSSCGPFGYSGDEASFWRVFQGYLWFFQLGQDFAQVDPGSFTLMRRADDGRWQRTE
ncbi:hypothetical protein [Sphingosinithalassobacter portus]|uniref:hypothetical protein n=1 Tax=Stakelama portus TaxID=2676234 RepID=UPI000D6E73E8|nr:hypothetical protein [Sphingosinithalassobacter portus]